jgi:hypothetical protein
MLKPGTGESILHLTIKHVVFTNRISMTEGMALRMGNWGSPGQLGIHNNGVSHSNLPIRLRFEILPYRLVECIFLSLQPM